MFSKKVFFNIKNQFAALNNNLYKKIIANDNSIYSTKKISSFYLSSNKNFNVRESFKNYGVNSKRSVIINHVVLLSSNEKSTISETEKRQAKLAEELKKKEIENVAKELQEKQMFLKYFPNRFEPYLKLMRLHSLAPIYLAYWPSAWAILGVASYQMQTLPDFHLLGLFAIGALTMRSAGCIINDIWDRKLDSQVERTKNRPLASGQVSLPSAFALLAANLSVSLGVLLQLNITTQVLGNFILN